MGVFFGQKRCQVPTVYISERLKTVFTVAQDLSRSGDALEKDVIAGNKTFLGLIERVLPCLADTGLQFA